jgi:hypothetical protein
VRYGSVVAAAVAWRRKAARAAEPTKNEKSAANAGSYTNTTTVKTRERDNTGRRVSSRARESGWRRRRRMERTA